MTENNLEKEYYPSMKDLYHSKYNPLIWIIKDYLPVGLALLHAKAKKGKSWLALLIGLSVATGIDLIPGFKMNEADVLLISNEDSPRRLQDRLFKILKYFNLEPPDNMYFRTSFDLFSHGGKEKLIALLETEKSIKLVIIDIMAGFIPFKDGNDYYEICSLFEPISDIAKRFNVCILFVHHSKKDSSSSDAIDDILGSTGIGAKMETILSLRSKGKESVLHIKGKEVGSYELLMNFDGTKGLWSVIGNADEIQYNETQEQILECLKVHQLLGPTALAKQIDKPKSTIQSACIDMMKKGILYQPKGDGIYAIL